MTAGEPGDEASPAQPVAWPGGGVVRVHFDPAALPALGDEPGVNRFDDPRPRTEDRFLMRYAATSLRACLLELLDVFRDNPDTAIREAAIDDEDPDLVEAPAVADWQALHDYLQGRKVATITADRLAIVSINDPELQRALDDEVALRAVLDSASARHALLEAGGRTVHLDNAAVRLSSETGRDITQACALALFDRLPGPDVIHYRSRHDDSEDCWAIYGHASVDVHQPETLNPHIRNHADALRSVATLWGLALPPAWADPRNDRSDSTR